ncbi:MAG TPA: protease modulator HflK, partial [Clostridia bacterium]|nr:protease modulator HflK [Clostridia bacterium]
MERNIQKNGIINLLALLGAGAATFAVARYSHSLAGQVGVVYLALGALVAAVSWFQMRLEESERLEKLEFEELAKSRNASALFEAKEADVFPAQRSREQFERFFLPVFTVLLGLLQAGGAYFFWRWLSKPATQTPLREPMTAMFLFLIVALVLFILGRFSAAYARLENNRLLRPSAGYLLLNAILTGVIGIGIVGVQIGFPKADYFLAYGLCVVLAVVAMETLIALVLEVYRPRIKGKIGRPLYESRLVGLLGQPEGLITTAAQAIDYQFGFKVSETWFYRFFERAMLWLIPLQLGLLLLSTCFVVIEPGEQGLLEHFGKPVAGRTVLGPGAHIKWPWPIDNVYRHRTEQIQSFTVGSAPDERRREERVVLWTVAHSKEENFLVANRVRETAGMTNAATGKRTPPVSLLTVSIPVQYQVTNLVSWVYGNEDAPALMQDLATREVVRFLAGVDMNEVMSHGRLEAAAELEQRIQLALDDRQLGARIISVGLQDLHPPVKVAPDYEKVIGALQTKKAKVLAARAEEIRTNALAQAQAVTVVNRASAERTAREIGALAQAALFTNQIPAFAAAPSVYAQRAYLEAFARATAHARKYVVLTTNTQDVVTFDLQTKIREDLLN